MEDKRVDIDEKTQVIVSMPQVEQASSKMQFAVAKILKDKSVKKEEKKKQLMEDGNANEIELDVTLSKDDKDFYYTKKATYLEFYPELTDPFDQDDLHHMIIEQIFQRNLLKKQRKNPNAQILEDYQSSVKREADFKKSLNVRRTDRMKDKKGPRVVNIAELSMKFSSPDELNEMTKRLKDARDEEAQLRGLGDKAID